MELPRYAVAPKNRLAPGSRQFSARRSKLDGGSWTIFEWERQEVGMRILRVQYPTQLRKPQVEVDFGELVSYLHSLGAIPDEQGWKRLRSSGLWMPKGLSLMNSPDGSQKALVIASLDDSDGNLSLAATADWSPDWVPESSSFQPPNVVRLPSPTTRGPVTTAREAIEAYECPQKTASSDASKDLRERKVDLPEKALNSPREKSDTDADGAVVCHLHSYGLSDAHMQTSGSLTSTVIHNILDIEHLRVRAGNPDGIWFASAATAYKTASKTILWSYTIPDDILSFASKATVPCGVLVLLGLANSSETPEWATKRNAHDEEGEAFFHKMAEERLAAQAGTDMSPEQGRVTASDRKRAEQQRRLQDCEFHLVYCS